MAKALRHRFHVGRAAFAVVVLPRRNDENCLVVEGLIRIAKIVSLFAIG